MDERLSEIELLDRLHGAASRVSVGKTYRHYKGNEYQVVALALIEATSEPAVIYEALYSRGLRFMRPISDWLATVEQQGETVARFALIEDQS